MPSLSHRQWTTRGARILNEIDHAHTTVRGTDRRLAMQQVNHAYAVSLASQFQKFCRDLHSESVNYLISSLSPTPSVRAILQKEFTRDRQLDRGNAQPGSLGADFGRLGMSFWTEVELYEPRSARGRVCLEKLNAWRNAIVHQNFDPAKLGGDRILRLARIRRWRVACNSLARSIDESVRNHLQIVTGTSPW
jgi:hypothetical protein